MKLIQLLNVMDDDSFLTIRYLLYGVWFTTKHRAEYLRENGCDELKGKEIKKIIVINGEMNVELGD